MSKPYIVIPTPGEESTARTNQESQSTQEHAPQPAPNNSWLSTASELLGKAFPDFTHKSFTFVITMIQIIIMLLLWFYSITRPSPQKEACLVYSLGACYGPALHNNHEFRRLIIPVVLHLTVGHIFANLLSQSVIGYRLEKHFGIKKYVAVYILSGIGGNLTSATFTSSLSIGASTAIFGIIGLNIAFIKEKWNDFDALAQKRIVMYMFIVLVMGILPSVREQLDIAGHIGGFITGAFLAGAFYQGPMEEGYRTFRIFCVAMVALYFAGTSLLLFKVLDYQPDTLREYCGY
jgi:rhomboid protease GluP